MFKFPHMCRLCLIPSHLNSCIKIFDDTSEIPMKILELTNVKVETEDGLPQEVCILCRAQLDLSVTFKRQVQKADSMLRDHLTQLYLQNKNESEPEDAILGDTITGDPLSGDRLEIRIKEESTKETEQSREFDAKSTRKDNDTNSDLIENTVSSEKDTTEEIEEREEDTIEEINEKEEDDTEDMEKCGNNKEETKETKGDGKETDSSLWEDVFIKVEDNIVIAEPWPEPALGENNSSYSDKNVDEENVTLKTEIKEEMEAESSNNDTDVMSSEDDDKPLIELLNRTFSDHIKCSCKFCSENNAHFIPHNDEPNSNIFQCVICLEVFETENLLKKHKASHQNRKGFECVHCTKCFSSRSRLRKHKRQEHRSKKAYPRPKKPLEQPKQSDPETQPAESVRRSSRPSKAPERHVVPHYSCSKCERMYSDEAALENHEKSHLGKTGLKCNHCGRKYYSKELLESHIQRAHILRSNRDRLRCNICGMKCENRSNFFSHMRSHKSTTHLCEVCGKVVSLNAYPAHKKSHLSAQSEEVFQCELCEKKFNTKISLRNHKISYHGPLKYTCEVCGKQFTTMALMKHHQHVHSAKRDHVCQVCGRGFTLKITLKSHMRIHTGEMPYKCDKCGRQFTWKTTYRNHIAACYNNEVTPKPRVKLPPVNAQCVPISLPQKLPINYSEEPNYDIPIDYSDESKYRHMNVSETKNFPIVLHFNEEMRYASQLPVNLAGCSRDWKYPM